MEKEKRETEDSLSENKKIKGYIIKKTHFVKPNKIEKQGEQIIKRQNKRNHYQWK
jgi:hypothetical protein